MGNNDVIGAIITWREASRHVRGPMRLSGLAWHALALSAALPAAREPVSCRKGCWACCRHVVPLTPPEAFHIAELVAAAPIPRKRTLLRRFRAVSGRLRREGMLGLPLLQHGGDYFRLGISCPFLEAGSCSIHGGRPLVCREHLAVSPAENCSDYGSAFIRMLPRTLSVREALAELTADCAGTGHIDIPLTSGLAWTAGHEALSQRTWDGEWLLDRLAGLCLAQVGAAPQPVQVTPG